MEEITHSVAHVGPTSELSGEELVS